MMKTRKARAKRIKSEDGNCITPDVDEVSISSSHFQDEESARKSRIRDSNKEFARRMTILQAWSEFWTDYTIRDGEAYPKQEARNIIKRTKKIACPIASCGKTFTSVGGLKYHYARCNIERSFKCKICNPVLQATTRGELLRHLILNHYEDLPDLNDEQKIIVNSYLSGDHRAEKTKKDRKVGSNGEPWLNAPYLIRAYKELQDKVYNSETFQNRPFVDWISTSRDWELLINQFDRKRYYPPESRSVFIEKQSEERDLQLETGESVVLNRDKRGHLSSLLFYTGGINTAVAWMPKSLLDKQHGGSYDIIAVSVNCCSMDQSTSYRQSKRFEGCIQFWSVENLNKQINQTENSNAVCSLSYLVGHSFGIIFDLVWCPLGVSWQPQVNTADILPRLGLLALACGDGKVRILSIPHSQSLLSKVIVKVSDNILDSTPMFKVKPIATLIAPGVGISTNTQAPACKSLAWNQADNQRLLAAGYSNGYIALFDLANSSPILYSYIDSCHIYHPLRTWIAHGAPVTAIAISSSSILKTLVSSGSTDRQVKIWNPWDTNCCNSADRAPVTKILWDYRFRGIISATDTAFTSFQNRVQYRYPVGDNSHNITVSTHRTIVWGLANSLITNSIATSDGAGEVFIVPQLINRSLHKRDKNLLSTHSLYTMLPYQLKTENSQPDSRTFIEKQEPIGSACSRISDTNITNETSIALNATQKFKVTNATNSDAEDNDEVNFSAERTIANKPTEFLLPILRRPVETYSDFKEEFGLRFVHYNFTPTNPDSKLPESCIRASDTRNIYCDRPCDYPFSSINVVAWSPNVETFPYLLSATQVGICRLDKVQIVDQIFRGHVDSILRQKDDKDIS